MKNLQSIGELGTKLGLAHIPGAKALYHVLYETRWALVTRKVWDIEGSKMYLDTMAKGSLKHAFRGFIQCRGKESLTTKLFKDVVKEGATVVDLGANIGYYTLLAARLVGPNGIVYSFEPSRENFDVLSKNIALNGYTNVVAEQMAVSDITGVVKLYLADTDVGAHTLRHIHSAPQFTEKDGGKFANVKAVTLDDYFSSKTNHIDVIKMDIEGAEMLALQGMDGILTDNPGIKLFAEFYPTGIREIGCVPEHFVDMLMNHYGFSITAIDELRDATNEYIKIISVSQLMGLCSDREKIVNLFMERTDKK